MNNAKPRFRILSRGKYWYILAVNEAAEAMKIPAWKCFGLQE